MDALAAPSDGQSARVRTNSSRTPATRSSRSSTVQSSTEIGGSTATSIVPLRMNSEPRQRWTPALRITTGTIGTPLCIARWNAPFLNGPTRGVGDRVPSGEMASE